MSTYTISNDPEEIDVEARSFLPRTLQNAKNLLRTKMGEVPYDRMRGINPAIFDRPLPYAQGVIRAEVERVLAWEPDAFVIDARCCLREDGTLRIEAEIEIQED